MESENQHKHLKNDTGGRISGKGMAKLVFFMTCATLMVN